MTRPDGVLSDADVEQLATELRREFGTRVRSWAEIVRYIVSTVPDVATGALSRAADLAEMSGPNAEHVTWWLRDYIEHPEKVAAQTAGRRRSSAGWLRTSRSTARIVVTHDGAWPRRAATSVPPGTIGAVAFPRSNQKDGPLAGHVRKGRVYKPPLVATGLLKLDDWARDDLPDLLWPILVMAESGTSSFTRFVSWQKAVQGDLKDAETRIVADGLDARLTSLDRLVDAVPEAAEYARARATEHGLLSDAVSSAMLSYPYRPAAWLVEGAPRAPGQDDLDLASRALFEVLGDDHREAVVKCLYVWSAVQAGTFRSSQETIDLLQPYPYDPVTRKSADVAIRAMWGARKGALRFDDERRFDDAIRWARVFWGANSMTTGCARRRDLPTDDPVREEGVAAVREETNDDEAQPTPMPTEGAHLRRLAMDLLSSYVEALETAPARLHEREVQEVHSGLVASVGRQVIAALGAPDLWCSEHGSHVTRTIVEVRIYLEWMALQDPSIYKAYQDYGAGKAKLYAKIMDEVPSEAQNPDFVTAVEKLGRLGGSDSPIDFRVVDTRDTFANGKSIRAMAEECGLIDFYRQTYSMSSGVAHSEWWSVEMNAMERCLNVLHGGHLVPNLSLNAGGSVELAQAWVDQLYTLIRNSLQILQTDTAAVESAFEWLGQGDDEKDEGSADEVA